MVDSPLTRARRGVGVGMLGVGVLGLAWMLTPGIPVLFAPRVSAEVRAAGLELFAHEWQPHDAMARGDGLGPVFNARSCVECHSQGGVGGGGDNSHNVLAFEAFPTQDRPDVKGGLIHKFAVANQFLDSRAELSKCFPIIPNGIRVEGGCQVFTQDFDPVHTQAVNSTALFGAGWVDRISAKTIRHESLKTASARMGREIVGHFGGVIPGRPRVLTDGRVGKFGWKAQFATLEEFVSAACANEIGLGNPGMEQARPMVRVNYPQVERDLTDAQFRSLVGFVDSLPRPVEVVPDDHAQRSRAERGKVLFAEIGCAACHTPDMAGVQGVYSDFLLHRLDDRSRGGSGGGGYSERPPVPLPEDYPLPEEWKTPLLWGVADSAPYFHDGGSPTLETAIQRHHGDAESVTAAYQKLAAEDRAAVIAFLKTLRAPADAEPVSPPTVARRHLVVTR
ncbi:di-heme oxidoredictase family protein [Aquisphaera insulae]|uniref:di-heme oxidoredictase family protein n=1 Tax=Aquisphaera insulae TaxID=2712864 RepID=UPI0013EC83FD|nr:di-heme oxidoredictase family protein [Aquisphaera insulae]